MRFVIARELLSLRAVTRAALCLSVFFALLPSASTLAAEPGIHLDGPRVQGGMVRGRVAPGSAVQFEGEPVRVSKDGWFLIGFGRDAPPKAVLAVMFPDGRRQRYGLAVKPRKYRIQRIDGLPPGKVTPRSKEDLARIRREVAMVKRARTVDDPRTDFLGTFRWPVKGRISGVYGSQRILNGEPRRPHFGIDIAAPKGTKVVAPAAGVVTLVHRDMFFSGGTMIVDHGHGLSSAFLPPVAHPGQEGPAGEARATHRQGRLHRPLHRTPSRLAHQPVRPSPRRRAAGGADAEIASRLPERLGQRGHHI